MVDVFLSIFLISNAVFELASYYFFKLKVRYSKILNQAHICVGILAQRQSLQLILFLVCIATMNKRISCILVNYQLYQTSFRDL